MIRHYDIDWEKVSVVIELLEWIGTGAFSLGPLKETYHWSIKIC